MIVRIHIRTKIFLKNKVFTLLQPIFNISFRSIREDSPRSSDSGDDVQTNNKDAESDDEKERTATFHQTGDFAIFTDQAGNFFSKTNYTFNNFT
jgi:hypothetical protein